MTSARDLSAHLAELLHRERAALAEFLVALADFDRKRLWIELGPLFHERRRTLEGPDAREPERRPAAVLPALEAGRPRRSPPRSTPSRLHRTGMSSPRCASRSRRPALSLCCGRRPLRTASSPLGRVRTPSPLPRLIWMNRRLPTRARRADRRRAHRGSRSSRSPPI